MATVQNYRHVGEANGRNTASNQGGNFGQYTTVQNYHLCIAYNIAERSLS